MSTERILITQGTTAFAQRVAKLFGESELSFASSDPIPHGLENSGRYFAIPQADHATFIHEVLKLTLDKEIGFLLPLGFTEASVLASSKLLFREYGVEVLVSDPSILKSFDVLENPPRQFDLTLVHQGRVRDSVQQVYSSAWNGLFSFNDHSVFQCFAKI